MVESNSKATASRAPLLFYVVGVLLVLAFTVDLIQDDGFDWVLLGGATASLAAGVTYPRKRRHN